MKNANKHTIELVRQRIEKAEYNLKKLSRTDNSITRKINSRKKMKAGEIFEKAGIIETYDYDFILGLLASLDKLNISDVVYRQLKNIGMDIRLKAKK